MPLLALTVTLYVPTGPAGVPEIVAVPSPLSRKLSPVGKLPLYPMVVAGGVPTHPAVARSVGEECIDVETALAAAVV